MPDRRIVETAVGAADLVAQLGKHAYDADEERDDLHRVVKRLLAVLTDPIIDDHQKVDQASQLAVKSLATWDARRADVI